VKRRATSVYDSPIPQSMRQFTVSFYPDSSRKYRGFDNVEPENVLQIRIFAVIDSQIVTEIAQNCSHEAMRRSRISRLYADPSYSIRDDFRSLAFVSYRWFYWKSRVLYPVPLCRFERHLHQIPSWRVWLGVPLQTDAGHAPMW
jgi:hypothetical protein